MVLSPVVEGFGVDVADGMDVADGTVVAVVNSEPEHAAITRTARDKAANNKIGLFSNNLIARLDMALLGNYPGQDLVQNLVIAGKENGDL